MQYLQKILGIQDVRKLTAYSVSFLACGEMITQIESTDVSAAVSPALTHIESAIPVEAVSPMPFNRDHNLSSPPELIITPMLPKSGEFNRWNSLLKLKGKKLFEVVNEQSLKVSFQSSTNAASIVKILTEK